MAVILCICHCLYDIGLIIKRFSTCGKCLSEFKKLCGFKLMKYYKYCVYDFA